MNYKNVPVKSNTYDLLTQLKEDINSEIPEKRDRVITYDEMTKFILELVDKETLIKLICCKKAFLKDNPEHFDITYNDLMKRILEFYTYEE